MTRSLRASLLTLLLMLPSLAPAQETSVGIYADTQGTDAFWMFAGSMDLSFQGYVVAFHDEGAVGGASWRLGMMPGVIHLFSESYADGVQFGDPVGCGVEMGLTIPVSGLDHQPVLLATLTFVVMEHHSCYSETLSILPHCNNDTVLIAEASGALLEAEGKVGVVVLGADPVEPESWGLVKSLYR